MVVYDKTYKLGANAGDGRRATSAFVIAHETGNANNVGANSAKNEASYMKNNWRNAYTHAIAGHDKVYIVGEPGYVAYGAGSYANERSPFQIELARYSDKKLAIKAYQNYVNAIREYCVKYGIPTMLDGTGNGVKSHKYISDNYWGDHQDPYSYLSSIGIRKAQFASDLKNGFGKTQAPAGEFAIETKPITTVKYDGKGNVRLANSKGIYIDNYLKPESRWKVSSAAKLPNIGLALKVGTDKYLPIKYTNWLTFYINYTKNYGVNAVDGSLKQIKGSNAKFKADTHWKTTDIIIKDGVFYFGTGANYYIPFKYVKFEK